MFAFFGLLAKFPEMMRDRVEFTPFVRNHPSGSHLIVYRLEGQGIEIVRILHAHQNLMAYLSDNSGDVGPRFSLEASLALRSRQF